MLYRLLREDNIDKETLEWKSEGREEPGHVNIWEKSIIGNAKSMFKGI